MESTCDVKWIGGLHFGQLRREEVVSFFVWRWRS
jgi:hypothetical protein